MNDKKTVFSQVFIHRAEGDKIQNLLFFALKKAISHTHRAKVTKFMFLKLFLKEKLQFSMSFIQRAEGDKIQKNDAYSMGLGRHNRRFETTHTQKP